MPAEAALYVGRVPMGNSREDKYEVMTLALGLLPPRAHQTAVPV